MEEQYIEIKFKNGECFHIKPKNVNQAKADLYNKIGVLDRKNWAICEFVDPENWLKSCNPEMFNWDNIKHLAIKVESKFDYNLKEAEITIKEVK